MKVFISGSISIKKLPNKVINSLNKIKENNFEVLVGDAKGIDSLIQDFYQDYENVTIYTAEEIPRYISNSYFNIKYISTNKTGREKHTQKDIMMTFDSDYSFVIWDGKSKGSYLNIIRAIENNKKVKVYLNSINNFIKANKNEIEFIFRENNGYNTSEILELSDIISKNFKNSRELNKYLLNNNILFKENNIYMPNEKYKNMFIVEKYRGKIKGVKFKNSFIKFLEDKLSLKKTIQTTLFSA